MKETKQKLTIKIDRLEEQCDDSMKRADELATRNDHLQTALLKSQRSSEELGHERDEYGKKLNDLKASLGDANVVQNEILQQMDRTQAELTVAKQRGESLENELTDVKEEVRVKTCELERTVDEVEQLKNSMSELERAKLMISETANKTYFELKEKLGQLECENDALRDEIERATSEKDTAFLSWNSKNEALREQEQILSEEVERLKERSHKSEEEAKTLSEEKEELEKQLEEKDCKVGERLQGFGVGCVLCMHIRA